MLIYANSFFDVQSYFLEYLLECNTVEFYLSEENSYRELSRESKVEGLIQFSVSFSIKRNQVNKNLLNQETVVGGPYGTVVQFDYSGPTTP